MASAARRVSSRSRVTSPRQRTASPGPGKGCRQTISSGSPSCRPSRRTSSLKRSRSGSIKLESKFVRQATDVVVQLDRVGRPIAGGPTFDHVGIERSLGQEFRALDTLRLFGKTVDECVSDAPTLLLRVGHSGESRQKLLFSLYHVEVRLKVLSEFLDNCFFFVESQEAIVNQDA